MSLHKLLHKAKAGADSAEIFSVRTQTLEVSFENSVIKDSRSKDLGGLSTRVIKNGQVGFSSSSEPDDENFVQYALDLVEHGKKVKFELAKPADVSPFSVDTSDFDKLTENFAISECEKVINELKTVHDHALAQCGIVKRVSKSHILNSKGVDVEQTTKLVGWACALTYNTEGNFLSVMDFRNADKYTGFEPMVKRVKEDFAICQTNSNIEQGKYRVLFSPRGFMYLIDVFVACLNGFAVAKGISPWTDKIGEKLFDERISVYSDLISKDASLRVAVDDEGTQTGKTHFIEKGVLKSFYHSLDTAAQTGQLPTGHGFRGSFASQPSPAFVGGEFAPGKDSLNNMLKDTQIYIDDLIGAIMSNPYSGVITGSPSMGFIVKDGKKVAHIKDAMLSINIFDLFKNGILAVSKEREQLGYEPFFPIYRAPYYLIDGVSLSAK